MNTQYYNVAHHYFGVTIEETLAERELNSFKPFEVSPQEAEASPRLFNLTQVPYDAEVEAALNLNNIQQVGGEEELAIEHARINETNGHFLKISYKHLPPCCIALCSADFTNISFSLFGNTQYHSFALSNLLMIAYALTSSAHGTLMFHSSVVMNGGYAYMFLGKSGTGKSTHSSLWIKYIEGTELLNDDNPIVRVYDSGETIVYGSPWSGKTPCYKNKQAPIGGIVRLWQAPHNEISRLNTLQAYAALAPTVSNMKWVRSIADAIHNSLTQLLVSTPVYALKCLPDQEAAQLSFQTISKKTK